MPVPSNVRERAPMTRWKRSNSRSWSAGSIPMPVSATVSSAAPSTARSDTVIRPANVNFSALDSRFMTILAHISPST